ncbi:MAG TPA: toll/interleukin-1 receptor domain-containing protein [Polyangiaceae bacterium]|nr:toll/interleukin-1 receptor domain-containing protein [Polyangiaceae bacterium]
MPVQSPVFPDGDWDDLLDQVERGNVIPVVGEGAVTFGPNNEPLYPAVALELAEALNVERARLSATPSVNEVAREHLLQGGERNRIYSRLDRIVQAKHFTAGETLVQLAGIEGFLLYLSTTFDPLLQGAICQERKRCAVAGFYPGALEKDLSSRAACLGEPTVYHLLGRSSVVAGEFVAWEEDLLDFLTSLPQHLGSDTTRNLSTDLRLHSLLVIGLRFSDWVLRLLLRIARQDALSRVTPYSWLAEGHASEQLQSSVLFFGSVSKSIKLVQCRTPTEFVAELHRRWRARHRQSASTPPLPAGGRGLVFISYAREDEAAARQIERSLREQGCTVYFDQERLGAGQNYHHQLEDQVSRDCAVFVSVVSEFTESALGDRYFRRERNWAAKRLEAFAAIDQPKFYLPLVIHEQRPEEILREPAETRNFQRIACPRGLISAEVATKIRALQRELGGR